MLVKTYGSAIHGIEAITITVEVNVSPGVNFFIVGLPDNAVKESQQRIDACLRHVGFKIPGKRIIVNMAPADIRKQGSSYDLAIAIGILAANGTIKYQALKEYIIIGELSLDGGLQPIRGILPIALQAKADGFKGIILPVQNVAEAAIVNDLLVYGITNIQEVIDFFNEQNTLVNTVIDIKAQFEQQPAYTDIDFAQVKGQSAIKRSFEIAAAGGHNMLLIGPPGAGKTMLAKRLPGILPPLTLAEAIDITRINSVVGRTNAIKGLISHRPFKNPHHTISSVALIGGGAIPQPGEVSLAHHGILFLDELPEFNRSVLEVLRQPLEDGNITISRARSSVVFPAKFMLIASMNPCPCGYFNDPNKACTCTPGMVNRYLSKISGPLLDRIDLHCEVTPVNPDELTTEQNLETSVSIRQRVMQAREIQQSRLGSSQTNAHMTPKQFVQYCRIDNAGKQLMHKALQSLGLSARGYDRILKIARTIADLDASENIHAHHLAEAIHYRTLDRNNWGTTFK